MKPKLSIIITGRNDNHNNDFLKRLNFSMKWNIELLDISFKYNYEYVIVDWGSEPGHCIFRQENIYYSEAIKHIIVPKSIISEKFNAEMFYQFYAKNVGIIWCEGEFILMINADNLLSISLVETINDIFQNGFNREFYYRTKYWCNVELPDFKIISSIDCNEKCQPDEKNLGIVYSGDFMLINKDCLINKGKGFDESNINHSSLKKQAHMDGELIFNLFKNGIEPVIFDDCIYHINHEKSDNFDYHYNKKGYENTDNWGFQDKQLEKISKNIFKLK